MGKKLIFFRNNGLTPSEITKNWQFNGKLNLDWPQFENRTVIYTYLGRIGNALICQMLNVQEGDEILVPSYNCGSEVDPFLCFGMKAVMYRVDGTLNIDLEDVQRRLSTRSKILYVTHFFGWPQRLEEISIFCRENNLFLIEDCALALFSHSPAVPIGRHGDAAIYSFRKTLPVPDGAALVLRSDHSIPSIPEALPPLITTAKELAPYLVRWLMHSIQSVSFLSEAFFLLYQRVNKRTLRLVASDDLPMPQDYHFSIHIMPLTMSRISSGILSSTEPEKIIAARRRNYQQLLEGILEIKNLKPLFTTLPPGVCPLLMPVKIPDVITGMQEFNRLGIKAIRWWEGFNQKLDWQEFPEAVQLKNQLLALPVHQYLQSDDIGYMVRCIQDKLT